MCSTLHQTLLLKRNIIVEPARESSNPSSRAVAESRAGAPGRRSAGSPAQNVPQQKLESMSVQSPLSVNVPQQKPESVPVRSPRSENYAASPTQPASVSAPDFNSLCLEDPAIVTHGITAADNSSHSRRSGSDVAAQDRWKTSPRKMIGAAGTAGELVTVYVSCIFMLLSGTTCVCAPCGSQGCTGK